MVYSRMTGKKISSILIKILVLTVFLLLLIACARDPVVTTTHNDEVVIVPDHNYDTPEEIEYSIGDIPEFVNDISECLDENKKYVLPDGYVYESAAVPLYSVTNQLEISTDIDGSVFNGCGYQDNARIRGILEIGESDYSFITGLIPVKRGDKIYFSGNMFNTGFKNSASMNIAFYNDKGRIVSSVSLQLAGEGFFDILETNSDGYASCIQLSDSFVSSDFTHVRFTLVGSGKDQIISVNEPLEATDYKYDWVRSEQYIPADWFQEIKSTIDTVNNLDVSDESNLIKFVFASDIHLDPYLEGKSYTENLGKVCAEVMRACGVPFFVTGGDNCTQSSGFMPTDFYPNMQELLGQLSPIPQKNILLSVGNHDGATGMAYDHNG